MNLIFMGTPEFAVPALDALCGAGHRVTAVFTQPDKPKGRKLKLTPPPVKARAMELSIPVYQPQTLKDPSVAEMIIGEKADCIVVAAYGKLIPPAILTAAKYGCVNIHSSLLPKYRGAAPINWAVINGEEETGVSTMLLNEGLDTGDILLSAKTPIDKNETAGELHDRLAQMGAQLILATLDGLENNTITPIKQDDSLSCYAPMLDKSVGIIDWNDPAKSIHDKVRGLQPWPVATAYLGGERIRIHKTFVCDGAGKPGEVISVNPFTVACGSGAIIIEELQADGGKRMKSSDYFRGHPVEAGIVFDNK